MKLKVKGRTLLHAEFASEMPVAEFSPHLSKEAVHNIANDYNYGQQMLQVYGAYRDNLHINNVVEMLAEMEPLYRAHQEQKFAISRKHGFWAKCPGCGE